MYFLNIDEDEVMGIAAMQYGLVEAGVKYQKTFKTEKQMLRAVSAAEKKNEKAIDKMAERE